MERSRSLAMPMAVVAALIVVVLGAWYALTQRTDPQPSPVATAPQAAPAPAPAAPTEPAVAHPLPGLVPEAAMAAPVEPSPDALAAFQRDLAALGDAGVLARFIDPASIVRRVVSTVDNLASDELPMRARAVNATPGAFGVQRQGETLVVDPANARRYEPFVAWVESIDTKRAVDLYVRHYALFQGEYRGQGSPNRYFNDRLVAAIDHLLATPEPAGAIGLVQPKVQYRHADPALESLSAGQKALLRTGPQNVARLKARLRALRAEVAKQGGAVAGASR
ncbi:MAG: DUF3014 domain-containing protein [Burkholderiales bacterium]|nr:MAG: DUF3014 domain-containing protein [Burkholderiales bacterium]